MGWCKIGTGVWQPGITSDECKAAGGKYSDTDPNPPPPDAGTGGGTKTDCFIASAAYGSPLEPEVEFLRRFREDVLCKTRAGARFFEDFNRPYYRVSPVIVDLMGRDPRLKEVVRWSVVTPIVNHLDIALRFPDGPIEGLPEPWRSFLEHTRKALQEWAKAIALPEDFEGLSVGAAAEEIGIALRYLLRTEETRRAYLDRLAEHRQIPLRGEPAEIEEGAKRLRAFGRSETEIERVLGAAAGKWS